MPSDYRPNVPDEALDKFDKEKEKEEETPKVAKKPIEKWLDAIKEVGLSDIEAENILDEYLQKGFWEKDYNLFRGKLKVTLRTREGYSLQRVANSLDALRTSRPLRCTMRVARSRILTGSPISSTKTSPPLPIAPAWITNCAASGMVIK